MQEQGYYYTEVLCINTGSSSGLEINPLRSPENISVSKHQRRRRRKAGGGWGREGGQVGIGWGHVM